MGSAPVGPSTRPVSTPPRVEAERRLGCPQTALEASDVPVGHMETFDVSLEVPNCKKVELWVLPRT